MEKELGVTEARKRLSDIVHDVQHQGATYLLNRYGKPAAAVVPVEVYEAWLRQREHFFDLVREMQREAGLSPDAAQQLAAEAVKATREES